ncbi:MAG: hypothetical protein U1F26_08830 [Lysobacterales bacterium]
MQGGRRGGEPLSPTQSEGAHMSFVGIDVSKKELVLFHWERKIS